MNKIATSPLKIILFGEHSVLIGGRCIAVCINKYCDLYLPDNFKKETFSNFLITDIKNNKFLLKIEDCNKQFIIANKEHISKDCNNEMDCNKEKVCEMNCKEQFIIAKDCNNEMNCNKEIYKEQHNCETNCREQSSNKQDNNKQGNYKQDNYKEIYNGLINVNYQLGCGLGSSAAISILSAIALDKKKTINFYDKNISRENILKKANLIEDFFHGKSSGVDCATLKHGGMISFKNKEIEKMSFISIKKYKLVIYNSGILKDTKKCVKQNLNNKDENYKKLSEISEEAYNLLKTNFKLTDFYKLIKKAQDILEDLGVVPQIMKNEVDRLRKIGIESKITGAGNGGHLFTLIEKNISLENWEEVFIDEKGFSIN